MNAGGLPGPFARLWRQPLRVGAIVLLAVTALAASGIQSAAALALRSTLDENWRGAYDILVTAPDGLQPIDGMLPPNTLASGEGITFDQLEAVRALDGIDVAAPIGEVLVPGLKFAQPDIVLPLGLIEGATEVPKAFRVTATYTTDDGLGERIVERREFPLIVDETPQAGLSPADLAECLAAEVSYTTESESYSVDAPQYSALKAELCQPTWRTAVRAVRPLDGGGWGSSSPGNGEDFFRIALPSAPQTVNRLTLVDPEAERALLGAEGAFLDPLIETEASVDTDIPAMQEWAESADFRAEQLRAQLTFLASVDRSWLTDEAYAQLRQLYRDNGSDYDEKMAGLIAAARFVPLVVSDAQVAELRLKLDIEAVGDANFAVDGLGGGSWQLPTALKDGSPGALVGSSAGDISEVLNPFGAQSRPLVWPGVDLSVAEEAASPSAMAMTVAAKAAAGAHSAHDDGGVLLPPVGYTMPVLENEGAESALGMRVDPGTIGAEAAYTRPSSPWVSGFGAPPGILAVGEFSPDMVTVDESSANYVPLGAYAPVSSTLTSGEHAGATMLPSLSGLGLVSPRTVAIGSIYSSPLWDDDAPISAIRVRVAGIDSYTPENQQRVIEVAQAIEALGLSASIVAGSSPVDVDVQVDGYAFGTTDPAVPQTVGELGTVTQRWSELGAASRVSLSVSTATLAILGIALAAGILLLGAVQLAGIPGRRDQAVVMRELGFPRSRIARWFAGEEVPGLVVVIIVGAVAWWLSGGARTAAIAALVAGASVLATATASVIAGSRSRSVRMPRDSRSRRLGAHSVAAFGARQALVHPLTSSVHLLAIAIVGLSATALAAALLTGREDAGASSLALLTLGQQLWPQLALGSAGIISGILLARLTRRLDLARRADQWSTLRAAGWTSGQLARAQRVEGLAVVVPGIVVTAGLAWLGAWWLALEPVWLYVAVAAAAGLATGLVAFSTRRKGSA